MVNKIFMSVSVLLLLLSSGFIISTWDRSDEGVSLMSEDDYNCIKNSDNDAVKYFKYNMILNAMQNDINEHELTEEQFITKQKYFNPCN